jgi:hypothetical protein
MAKPRKEGKMRAKIVTTIAQMTIRKPKPTIVFSASWQKRRHQGINTARIGIGIGDRCRRSQHQINVSGERGILNAPGS